MPPRPDRAVFPSSNSDLRIQVTDDGSRTLVRNDSQDSYHSASGAMAETTEVYLVNSGVQQRIDHCLPSRVLEIGFGTGMAMLMTVDRAVAANAKLDYVAIESDLLSASVIAELDPVSWVRDPSLVENFLAWRESVPFNASESILHWLDGVNQRVQIHVTDARQWAAQQSAERLEPFDAIYFDPFSPESNPELWHPKMLGEMFLQLRAGGTLTSYCVKREVREACRAVGFQVTKRPGPKGGKREVLVAVRPENVS